jgi:hypothetical protein
LINTKANSAKKDHIHRAEEVLEIEGMKPYIKKFPDTKEATEIAIKKLEVRISKE